MVRKVHIKLKSRTQEDISIPAGATLGIFMRPDMPYNDWEPSARGANNPSDSQKPTPLSGPEVRTVLKKLDGELFTRKEFDSVFKKLEDGEYVVCSPETCGDIPHTSDRTISCTGIIKDLKTGQAVCRFEMSTAKWWDYHLNTSKHLRAEPPRMGGGDSSLPAKFHEHTDM